MSQRTVSASLCTCLVDVRTLRSTREQCHMLRPRLQHVGGETYGGGKMQRSRGTRYSTMLASCHAALSSPTPHLRS